MSKKSKIEPVHVDEAKRLKSLYADRAKGSQADFGAKYEIGSQGMVWQYLNAKSPLNLSAALKFASGLGCDVADFSERLAAEMLRSGQGPEIARIRNMRLDQLQLDIPHMSARGSMGVGELMQEEEEVIDRITLKKGWIKSNLPGCKIADLAVISGRGNSMTPTFNDGDLLLVDTAIREVNIDGVYVLSAHNRLFIKTVRQRIDGSFEISSDNPSVKTVDILNGEHQVTVHGRVVWSWNGKRL